MGQFDCIKVFLDNKGLVTQLQRQNASGTIAFYLHRRIMVLLQDFNVPFSFNWLPREHVTLKKADAIGRLTRVQIQRRKGRVSPTDGLKCSG